MDVAVSTVLAQDCVHFYANLDDAAAGRSITPSTDKVFAFDKTGNRSRAVTGALARGAAHCAWMHA
jgi:hypothetical protein